MSGRLGTFALFPSPPAPWTAPDRSTLTLHQVLHLQHHRRLARRRLLHSPPVSHQQPRPPPRHRHPRLLHPLHPLAGRLNRHKHRALGSAGQRQRQLRHVCRRAGEQGTERRDAGVADAE